MPTPLGVLPSDLPIPHARCQIKIGAVDVGRYVNNTWAVGAVLDDGNSVAMQVQYTPRYRCLWVLRGNMIWCGVDMPNWYRMDWGIRIGPADLDGKVKANQCITDNYPSSTVGWRDSSLMAVYRLEAGVAYTAWMSYEYSSGYTHQYWCGSQYLRLIGRSVAEGAI